MNEWNTLSTDRVHANGVTMFENTIDTYFIRVGCTYLD